MAENRRSASVKASLLRETVLLSGLMIRGAGADNSIHSRDERYKNRAHKLRRMAYLLA
jgi:hypothetical protein